MVNGECQNVNCYLMEEIIAPVSRKILKKELTEDKFLRPTNKAGNQIFFGYSA